MAQENYLLRSSRDVGLQKPDKGVNVSGPLPKNGDEQELEQLHVGLRHVAQRVVLQQQRQDLENVRHELLHVLEKKRHRSIITLGQNTTRHDYCIKSWNIPGVFLVIRLLDRTTNCEKIAEGGIRTADDWFEKRSLCQVRKILGAR